MRNQKKQIDQPTAVSDHFTLPVHSMDNIELVPLELITSNGDAIHKAREEFLSKTLEPVIGKFTFCEKNKIISLPFLRQIFNFLSFIPKKQAHLSCVLEKTRVSFYIMYFRKENKSIKLQQSWREKLNCKFAA